MVLGIGRLTRQKGFDVLLSAFARLRQHHSARLVILGDGPDRRDLLSQASHHGIRDDVAFLGFVPNPYPHLARSALFVLSSRWEGSPNVLTEAMALGTPVVATDCESGPREILEGGRHGPLVPVDDVEALAVAMAQVLDNPPELNSLGEAVTDYTLEKSSRRYLEALLGRNLGGPTRMD